MNEVLLGVALIGSIIIGFLAWKYHWKIADIL